MKWSVSTSGRRFEERRPTAPPRSGNGRRELETLGRYARADGIYAKLIPIDPSRAVEAWLRRGICRVALEDWGASRTRLAHAETAVDLEVRSAAWFWQYRASLGKGRPSAARTALVQAASGQGYYRWRAQSALALSLGREPRAVVDPAAYWKAVSTLDDAAPLAGVRAGAVGSAATDSGGTASFHPSPELLHLTDRLRLFRLCGREAWAAETRQELDRRPELGSGKTQTRRLALLGLADLSARSAALRGDPAERDRNPTPFAPAVAAAARRNRIAPEWLWALMRRESFFESSAVSPAGAVGLLQLMSATADLTATRHGLAAAPLRSPEVNLSLGAAHSGRPSPRGRRRVAADPGRV